MTPDAPKTATRLRNIQANIRVFVSQTEIVASAVSLNAPECHRGYFADNRDFPGTTDRVQELNTCRGLLLIANRLTLLVPSILD